MGGRRRDKLINGTVIQAMVGRGEVIVVERGRELMPEVDMWPQVTISSLCPLEGP